MSCTATVNDPHQPDAMPISESIDHATVYDAYRAPRRPRSKRYSPMTGSWSKGTVCMRSGLSTMTIGALVEIAVDRRAN